jgi:hypothetical protein
MKITQNKYLFKLINICKSDIDFVLNYIDCGFIFFHAGIVWTQPLNVTVSYRFQTLAASCERGLNQVAHSIKVSNDSWKPDLSKYEKQNLTFAGNVQSLPDNTRLPHETSCGGFWGTRECIKLLCPYGIEHCLIYKSYFRINMFLH